MRDSIRGWVSSRWSMAAAQQSSGFPTHPLLPPGDDHTSRARGHQRVQRRPLRGDVPGVRLPSAVSRPQLESGVGPVDFHLRLDEIRGVIPLARAVIPGSAGGTRPRGAVSARSERAPYRVARPGAARSCQLELLDPGLLQPEFPQEPGGCPRGSVATVGQDPWPAGRPIRAPIAASNAAPVSRCRCGSRKPRRPRSARVLPASRACRPSTGPAWGSSFPPRPHRRVSR